MPFESHSPLSRAEWSSAGLGEFVRAIGNVVRRGAKMARG
jgi:hypothetical protein